MLSNNDLLHRCRAGDRQAWEQIVNRYQRLLFSIALRAGLGEEDAADVFQTVCMRLHENLDRIENEQHLVGWLAMTCKREAWRVRKRLGRETSLAATGDDGPSDPLEALQDADPLPEESLVRLQEAVLVRIAMAELGERCRKLLTWLYHDDPTPSYQEIATRLDVSIGAIGPTRMRCLQQLKRILLRHGF